MPPQAPLWLISQAEYVSPVRVEVGFLIQESLYTGPANGFTEEQWQNSRDKLYQPSIKKSGSFALSADVSGHEMELARYYKDVLWKADRHGMHIKKGSSHFWNRPKIHFPAGPTFDFPWYDHFSEARRLFDAISSAKCDGEVFDDIDQCWEIVFWLQDGMLYASEFDPDDETTRRSFKFDYQPVKSQIAELIPRVERIISMLSDELGTDYWS
jgi:hypothetical protein